MVVSLKDVLAGAELDGGPWAAAHNSTDVIGQESPSMFLLPHGEAAGGLCHCAPQQLWPRLLQIGKTCGGRFPGS